MMEIEMSAMAGKGAWAEAGLQLDKLEPLQLLFQLIFN